MCPIGKESIIRQEMPKVFAKVLAIVFKNKIFINTFLFFISMATNKKPLNKKGQMMHQFGALDIFIVLAGVIIGIVLVYYFRDQAFIQNLICGGAPTPPTPTP